MPSVNRIQRRVKRAFERRASGTKWTEMPDAEQDTCYGYEFIRLILPEFFERTRLMQPLKSLV